MKISGQVESIFAVAVALEQSGNLRNTIYADGKEVFILNYDHTVLLRFRLRDSETPFTQPISFKANDYDSNEFYEEDGKIVFMSQNEGFQRKKICGKAEFSPDEIKTLINSYLKSKEERLTFTIDKSVLSLLDDSLSHIEISGKEGGNLLMIQRNIYSGGVIEISEKEGGMFDNVLPRDFGPIGIKTNDLKALFSFQDTLKFQFPVDLEKEDFVVVRSVDKNKRDMVGLISCCIYDELIELKENRRG